MERHDINGSASYDSSLFSLYERSSGPHQIIPVSNVFQTGPAWKLAFCDSSKMYRYHLTDTTGWAFMNACVPVGFLRQTSYHYEFRADTGIRVVSFHTFFGDGDEKMNCTLTEYLITDVKTVIPESEFPESAYVTQNYPNPFNPSTTIRFGLPERSHVLLTVFNTLGQQVATLVQGEQDAGYHEVRFDATGFSSGVYFYRLQAGNFLQTRKMALVR
jgi:hypothetical protein